MDNATSIAECGEGSRFGEHVKDLFIIYAQIGLGQRFDEENEFVVDLILYLFDQGMEIVTFPFFEILSYSLFSSANNDICIEHYFCFQVHSQP